MAKRKRRESVVKRGGVAREMAEIEDVTRDTYGDPQARPFSEDRDERLGEAGRGAGARDEEFRRAQVSGDRTAPPRDVEKLARRRRKTR